MAIATGVGRQIKYKQNSAWGTVPSAGSSQLLRRVEFGIALEKDAYESTELASHYQNQDVRHGVRSVKGPIRGELSPATYKDFMAAAVRQAWAAVTAISSLGITVAGTGPTYTVTRASGSWLSGGVKVGHVGRLSVGSLNAANINKNLFILAATATELTVMPLNGVALAAEGPVAGCTFTVIGKVTYAPSTAHTDVSFTFEDYHPDLSSALSEVYDSCKVNSLELALPATGMATINMDFLGRDITTSGSEYFTSPTAETTTAHLAAVNGLLLVGGSRVATLTSLNITINGGMTADAVVGSNTYQDIAEGDIMVSGTFTALFDSATLRDLFLNETESSIAVALSANNDAAADFIAITLPRIKVMGAKKDDGKKSLVQTLPFRALYNSSGGSGTSSEKTTIYLQDSAA